MEQTLQAILQVLTEIRDQNTQLKARVDALEHDTLLSRRDAAAYLKCNPKTLDNRRDKGYIKEKFIGGRKGYLLSDLTKIQ